MCQQLYLIALPEATTPPLSQSSPCFVQEALLIISCVEHRPEQCRWRLLGGNGEVRSLDGAEHVDDSTGVRERPIDDRRADVRVFAARRADDREPLGDADYLADTSHGSGEVKREDSISTCRETPVVGGTLAAITVLIREAP